MSKDIKCPKCGTNAKDYMIKCPCGNVLDERALEHVKSFKNGNNKTHKKEADNG